MPTRLDAEALHKAAATLPPAMEVNATEACTVDGSVHRNIRPSTIGGERACEAIIRSPKPASGNSAKVVAKTNKCSRQCNAPAKIAERDSRAPCRKNRSAMATDVRALNTCAPAPSQGSTNAIVTVAIIARVNWSGQRRDNFCIVTACKAQLLLRALYAARRC